MKFGPYTRTHGYICAPGGLDEKEGVFGGKTCTAEERKARRQVAGHGLASIEAARR